MWRWVLSGLVGVVLLFLTGWAACGWLEIPWPEWLGGDPWRYRRVMPLDLLEEYNNDGLAWERNPMDGNIHSGALTTFQAGGSFPADELPAPGARITVAGAGDLLFLFPSSRDGALNNVVCAGQHLRPAYARYEEVALLAASDERDEGVSIIVSYVGERETVRLRVPGWLENAPEGRIPSLDTRFHLAAMGPAAEGGGADGGRGMNGASTPTGSRSAEKITRADTPGHLWVCRATLKATKWLTGLTLPHHPRVHLFAVSLRVAIPNERLWKACDRVCAAYGRLGAERPPDRWGLVRELVRLREALAGASVSGDFSGSREMEWVETGSEYLAHRLRERLASREFLDEEEFRRGIRGLHSDLSELRAGRNPYPGKRGNILRSYRSEIDGQLQPYSLSVPFDYDSGRKFPLVMLLHGHDWYRPFQGHPTLEGKNYFFLSPHGRGSMDYMHLAEEDLRRVLEEVQRDYSIDGDRVVLAGHSMGGTGCWNMAVKFPHLFAAIAPAGGNTDRRVWEREWRWGRASPPGPLESLPEPFRALCTFVADTLDPVTTAGNLLNVPSFCLHGAQDDVVPVGHARSMVERLRSLGCPVRYREDADAGHGGYDRSYSDEQWNWLLQQERAVAPEVVRHTTWKLKYGKSYWAAIEQFVQPGRFAGIEAKLRERNLSVQTDNVQAFSVDWRSSGAAVKGAPETFSAEIDGQPVEARGASRFEMGPTARWEARAAEKVRGKRPYLEGPIEEVFTTPFLVVYGSAENDAAAAQVLRNEAYRFADDWALMYGKPCRIKSDREVTEEDIQSYSLVAYGNLEQNTIYRRIADRLPIRVDTKAVRVAEESWEGPDVGVKFCAPSPLNPERYFCVFAGTTWRGSYGVNNRFGNWFHWGAFDNRNWFDFVVFDERTVSPQTVLLTGFFDQGWELCSLYTYRGDAQARERALQRVVPEVFEASSGRRLYLSHLMPVRIQQHKGNVNSDRSFLGNGIRLGKERLARGLGVRAPSQVDYALDGKFNRFSCLAGIDLEGDAGTDVRKQNELIRFLVWGDGRSLFVSDWMQWDTPPLRIKAGIEGITHLRLEVQGSSAQWHFGSAAWGDAWVE
ncbi:MAG: NPCBM/NEW2 domain-containing protein [Planctomycetes bacterium]|nr:NPCBM/NEW2 domain-containing protein [Planctomycetota bacterium]